MGVGCSIVLMALVEGVIRGGYVLSLYHVFLGFCPSWSSNNFCRHVCFFFPVQNLQKKVLSPE